MIPLQLIGFLSQLGLGEQITVAATIGVILLYLFRSKQYAGTVAGVFGTLWFATISAGVVLVVALLTGWLDPNAGKFISDVIAGAQFIIEVPLDIIADYIKSAIDYSGF